MMADVCIRGVDTGFVALGYLRSINETKIQYKIAIATPAAIISAQ